MFQAVASTQPATAQSIDDLRRAIAAYGVRGGPRKPPIRTGLTGLDEALHGGLPRGKLVEVIGGAGKLSLTLRCLAAATERGELAALIDGADSFDPRAAEQLGVNLARLLWIRVKTDKNALRAADLVLDAGGFGLVALYLPGPPGDGAQAAEPAATGGSRGRRSEEAAPSSVWPRLVQRAERAEAAVLIASARPLAGSFASATLRCDADAALWGGAPGARERLLGLRAQIAVQRSRLGTPGDTERWVLRREPAAQAALAG